MAPVADSKQLIHKSANSDCGQVASTGLTESFDVLKPQHPPAQSSRLARNGWQALANDAFFDQQLQDRVGAGLRSQSLQNLPAPATGLGRRGLHAISATFGLDHL